MSTKIMERQLSGKTIKEATITESDDRQHSLTLEFTDGSTFSMSAEANPIASLFYYKDGRDEHPLCQTLTVRP